MMRVNFDNRVNWLKKIDLFKSFTSDELNNFAATLLEVRCPAGESLCREGEKANEMFVLLEGKLQIIKDKRKITEIEPVNYIGEMALIEDKPRSATVRAIENSRLLKVSADQFYNYFAKQPKLLVSMMKILSQRIRRDTEVMAEEFEKTNILIHDMKNCLSIYLFLDLFQFEPDSKEARYVSFMKEAGANLKAMMKEAMANAKRLSCHQNIKAHSLAGLIREMMASNCRIQPELQDKKIEFFEKSRLADFLFSKMEIRRVLLNLLFNAAQASEEGGVIEITLERQGDQVSVSVKDCGHGIAPEIAGKIFLPHFSTKAKGNGLGLPSCKQIIEKRHCGFMKYHPNPEGGSVFVFTLPIVEP